MKKISIFIVFLFLLFSSVLLVADNDISIVDLQKKLHTIANNVSPSVVSVSTEKIIKKSYDFFDPFDFFFNDPYNDNENDNGKNPKKREFKQGGLGSGVVYKQKGDTYYIVTNNHVIEGVDSIKVTVDQDRSYEGKVLGSDPDVDIGVIEIKTKDKLTVAKFGDSENLSTGDFVIAIGNPFGLQGTMTFGIISALGRSDLSTGRVNLTNFIQTDAAINPGNSGGALLNLEGEVIGINTLIYTRSGGNVGIGFAIPVNIAKTIADQIIEKGKVEHGYLGVGFEELNEEKIKTLKLGDIDYGMHVLNVFENSAAEKAGIKTGDVIIELDGKKLKKASDLTIVIGNSKPGTKVKLKLLRDGKIIEKVVELGSRDEMRVENNKDAEILENYGLELAELDSKLRKDNKIPSDVTGVVVVKVLQRGPAARVGIEEGDIIFKINNKKINNIEDIKNILKDSNNTNYFFIYRNGREFIKLM